MSDEAKPAESPEDALLGLTSLDFGPAWARGGGEKKGGAQEGKGKRHRDDRGEGRREGRRDDRGEGRRGGRRDDRKEGRRDDRRDGKGGGKGRRFDDRNKGDRGRRFDKGGRGRRDDDRGRPYREEAAPPEGYTAQVMPVEDGLDGLAKEIMAGGRTYSVFDLAKLVLGARERFNVSFRSGSESGLIRCKKDSSLWLNREEAMSHFLRSDWRKEFYEEVISEATAPKGNFQTVARCGLSNEWLGPPNYHGYQPAVAQMHRERFAHMSLDAYKRKIRMERGEEAVNAWLEKMSKRVAYRPTGGVIAEEPKAESDSPAESAEAAAEVTDSVEGADAGESTAETDSDVIAEESGEPSEEDASAADEEPAAEESAEENPAEEAEESVEEPPAAAAEEPLLEDMRDVERHFRENHFDDVFHVTNRAWVSGNIQGSQLSPGLLTLLRHTVAEERRYPGKLTPMLCRQLSGRHVAVFKWRRKLKAGPSRPHPVPEDITIADRPMSLLTWITENSGRKLDLLWKALLPADVSDEDKLGWYHDLHWLLNQGYVLLMADSTVHRAKKSDEGARQPAKGKGKSKKGKERGDRQKSSKGQDAPLKKKEAAPASRGEPKPADSPEIAPSGSPGLYALGGCTLSGIPKSPESLTGRGLWPLLSRIEAEQEDDEEGEGEGEEDWF